MVRAVEHGTGHIWTWNFDGSISVKSRIPLDDFKTGKMQVFTGDVAEFPPGSNKAQWWDARFSVVESVLHESVFMRTLIKD